MREGVFMGFKAGDRVKLTGSSWGGMHGQVVTVERSAPGGYEGMFKFRDEYGEVGYVYPEDSYLFEEWGGQLVEGTHGVSRNDLRSEQTSFETAVRRVLDRAGDELVAKNEAYGNSALDPVRIFSKADRTEQLYVRLDDKLSRVARGHEYPGDDTLKDILGYIAMILIARETE